MRDSRLDDGRPMHNNNNHHCASRSRYTLETEDRPIARQTTTILAMIDYLDSLLGRLWQYGDTLSFLFFAGLVAVVVVDPKMFPLMITHRVAKIIIHSILNPHNHNSVCPHYYYCGGLQIYFGVARIILSRFFWQFYAENV